MTAREKIRRSITPINYNCYEFVILFEKNEENEKDWTLTIECPALTMSSATEEILKSIKEHHENDEILEIKGILKKKGLF